MEEPTLTLAKPQLGDGNLAILPLDILYGKIADKLSQLTGIELPVTLDSAIPSILGLAEGKENDAIAHIAPALLKLKSMPKPMAIIALDTVGKSILADKQVAPSIVHYASEFARSYDIPLPSKEMSAGELLVHVLDGVPEDWLNRSKSTRRRPPRNVRESGRSDRGSSERSVRHVTNRRV